MSQIQQENGVRFTFRLAAASEPDLFLDSELIISFLKAHNFGL